MHGDLSGEGHGSDRPLGKMAFDGDGLQHRVIAEPRADTIGEQSQSLFPRSVFSRQVGLPCLERSKRKRGEPHEIEAEAGIDPVFEDGEPFMEKEADPVRFAQWPRRTDPDPAHRAVDPEKRQLQRPRAFAAPLEIRSERDGELSDQMFDRLHRHDRLGKAAFHRKRRGRPARRYRFLQPAQGLVHTQEELPTETPRQRRARRAHDRAGGAQADAFQTGADGSVDPERGEGQRRQEGLLLSRFHDAGGEEAGCRPGRAHRRGEARTRVEPQAEETGEKFIEHGSFAAEEVRAAGRVEEKAVLAVERHQRRIAVAPVGQAFEKPPLSRRIGLHDLDPGMHGARIRDPHAALQAERLGPLVKRRDAPCVDLATADEEGRSSRSDPPLRGTPGLPQPAAQDPVRGEMRKP